MNFPSSPGIYFFKDKDEVILYIGKAKSLSRRLKSYFGTHKVLDWKVALLLEKYSKIDYIVTDTEEDALALEAELISVHKPPFNVLLKGDQVFTYLVFQDRGLKSKTVLKDLPSVYTTRVLPEKKHSYIKVFGPFLRVSIAKKVYEYIIKRFKLYICGRTIEQGCLDYHLGICAGTCMTSFDARLYKKRYQYAKKIISGDMQKVHIDIDSSIQMAISDQRYEEAKELSEYKSVLSEVMQWLERIYKKDYEDDIERVLASAHINQNEYCKGFEDLKEFLKVSQDINTIDCVDISHFQGYASIGSVVQFTKDQYKVVKRFTYEVSRARRNDDYQAIKYVLTTHYKKHEMPDVLMIDGGKGQLSVAKNILDHPFIISLAKREETVFGLMFQEGVNIDLHTSFGKLLLSLRDLAHQTALFAHRKKYRSFISNHKKS